MTDISFNEQTRQITAGDISFDECVMVMQVTMTEKNGNLRRMPDGDIMPFDFIWTEVLEMETDDPEDPESSIRSIMMRRFEELKLEHPEKTSPQMLAQFRDSCEALYNLVRDQYAGGA